MNSIKKLFFILLIVMAFSCEKENEHQIIYRITDSVSGFDVRYLNESGLKVTEKITTQSAQDIWEYSFLSADGGIVFVSANYKDPESAVKVQIMVDGKLYKQAASKNDTIMYVTVSGVIPIRE
jgi:hypothetical protein